MSSIRILSLTGAEAAQRVPELARLRIAVFREFPYLYDGSLDYEERYLRTYLESRDAVIVAALDGDAIVGAATALPLEDETGEVIAPFAAQGWDVPAIFYFGESVLLRPYRGQGIGVAFFDRREAHARALGRFRWTCFCAVDRSAGHPRRPPGYVPLDAFWEKRGYRRVPGLETSFSWKDLDEEKESPKRMLFWMKELER